MFRLVLILLLIGLVLSGCVKSKPLPAGSPTKALTPSPSTSPFVKGLATLSPAAQVAALTPTLVATPIPSLPTPQPTKVVTYTVKMGDTLFSIALAHGVSVEAIVEANKLADPNRINVGQKLIIPQAPATPTSLPPTPSTPSAGRTYTVQPGDTLQAIAELFNTTLEALMKANNLTDPHAIKIGQVLRIPR